MEIRLARFAAIVSAGALGIAAGLIPATADAARLPGRVKATGATKAAIVRGFDKLVKDGNGVECYDVWLARSDSRWAQIGLSPTAYKIGCHAYDSGSSFMFNKKPSAQKWVYAGGWKGSPQQTCHFTITPPSSVRDNFRCWD